MANEGFSEEERRNAAEQIVRKVLPSLREHDDNMAQRVVVKIADPETKETFYAFVAIDLQCSLTRAQNELAEANKMVAMIPGFVAGRTMMVPIGSVGDLVAMTNRAELAESALAEANRKIGEARDLLQTVANSIEECDMLEKIEDFLKEVPCSKTPGQWVRVEDRLPHEEEYVLLLVGGKVAEGWWSSHYRSRWRVTRTPSSAPDSLVTHWQPLPAPPEPSERIPTEGSSGK